MYSVAHINRRRLRDNFRLICTVAGSGSTVLPVIKGNAYGHGAIEIARTLIEAGAQRFAVASVAEAVELRQAGIAEELIILCGLQPGEETIAVSTNLVPMIQTTEQLVRWQEQAQSNSKILAYHLEIDSGMTRLGFDTASIEALVSNIKAANKIRLLGIATHLATAQDFSSTQTHQQIQSFRAVLNEFEATGISPEVIHIANSAALAYRPELMADMVRPGLALYGYVIPSKGEAPASRLRVNPVLKWTAPILDIRDVIEGTLIGYNGSYRSPENMRVGVIGVGYADGFDCRLSGNGEVLIHGAPCPVIGLISMDLTLVDLRPVAHAEPGDHAILIDDTLDASSLADRCGTTVYEILCGISARVTREYV